jgi:transcriptional regulator with XRE-family HTH domain
MSLKRFQNFGQYASRRRLELDLSEEDVARKMGVSKNTVIRFEQGAVKDAKAENIFALARALKWTPEQLHRAFYGYDPGSDIKIRVEEEVADVMETLIYSLPKEFLERLLPVENQSSEE